MGSSERVAACFDANGTLLPNAARTGSTRVASDDSRLPCPLVTPVAAAGEHGRVVEALK
jgi:hypothetical protein